MYWSVQFIIKISSVFEQNFFIFKFHCFILLLYLSTFKYSFFRQIIKAWYQYFQICLVLGQFPGKHFLHLYCSDFVCFDFIKRSGSSSLAIFKNFLVFYFTFSSIPIKRGNFLFLLPEIGDSSGLVGNS